MRRLRDCGCGVTWDKLQGVVLGRTDYMITVRGTNVYPTAVENILGETPGVSPFFQLVLDHVDGNDRMTVEFEPEKHMPEADWEKVAEQVRADIRKALHVRLETRVIPPDGLPRYDLKTKRIVDNRPKELRRALDR